MIELSVQVAPIVILGGAGLIASIILYIVARKFSVTEDPRIAKIEALLPGANCGACGRKGCHDFAVACCNATSMDGLSCPSTGSDGMNRIAEILGYDISDSVNLKAIIKCNGTRCNRLVSSNAFTIDSCLRAASLAYQPGYCTWGCLGYGDCVRACPFNAINMNAINGIPTIDTSKCTGCGACSRSCPQDIISLIPTFDKRQAITVVCSNRDKGAIARKTCITACIGCGKCVRTCPENAISLSDTLATINQEKCIGCAACIESCTTGAIRPFITLSC